MKQQEITALIVDKLSKNSEYLTKIFSEVNPDTTTKYFILDDLLPAKVVMDACKSFPKDDEYFFKNTFREKKFSFKKLNELKSPNAAILTDALQSKAVIGEIEKITKINNLVGDFSLYAGGLSRMDQTHFLNPHIDNSHDGDRLRYRRLNILFYVSLNIDEKDGGNFELWDKKITSPVKIASKFNRLVVMETTKTSWHSVDPVLSDVKRCCLSNYYFSAESPTGSNYYHVTSFSGRPGEAFKRTYGRVDNFLRQTISSALGVSSGKKLSRTKG
jgi:Rps23 Pro-64 3,4-dihydroxylase Tpa1-like proline 4-hydroxylase